MRTAGRERPLWFARETERKNREEGKTKRCEAKEKKNTCRCGKKNLEKNRRTEKMGLFGLFGGGKGNKDEDDDPVRRLTRARRDSGNGGSSKAMEFWREVRGEDSPFSAMEKIEQAGFPGIGADDAAVAAGMAKAAAGANRKVVLTDEDRELFQYVRNMTARQEW